MRIDEMFSKRQRGGLVSRRHFLKMSGVTAIGGIGGLFFSACDKSPTKPEEEPPL